MRMQIALIGLLSLCAGAAAYTPAPRLASARRCHRPPTTVSMKGKSDAPSEVIKDAAGGLSSAVSDGLQKFAEAEPLDVDESAKKIEAGVDAAVTFFGVLFDTKKDPAASKAAALKVILDR